MVGLVLGIARVLLACAGWNDLPGELHREILRLVPLADARVVRHVSREMRDEVDEVWRAWGIRATAEDKRNAVRERWRYPLRSKIKLDFGPLVVWAFEGSHAHHLASMGLWRLAMLVAEVPDLHSLSWRRRVLQQSPLTLAVLARRPVGEGADGKVAWAHALGDEEVARMVRGALAMGADVNRRLHGAWPLMTYCAARGCSEAVKACLAAGAKVDARSEGAQKDFYHRFLWWLAVVCAAYWGHEAVVEVLLEAGAAAKVGAYYVDRTLITVCEGHPTPGIVRRLVEAGAEVDSPRSDETMTALCCAACRGNVAVMETLAELGAVIKEQDPILMAVAANGDVVRWLAARGVSVEPDEDHSPLHLAITDGRVDALRALVEVGAEVNGWYGKTPLHCVVEAREEQAAVEITRALLAGGADVHARDGDGRTALHLVRYAACVGLLVDAGADLEAGDKDGKTPLHCAVEAAEERAPVEVTRALLAAGANANATDGHGRRPLHLACYAVCVSLLVDAGADLEARDGEGKTPLHHASCFYPKARRRGDHAGFAGGGGRCSRSRPRGLHCLALGPLCGMRGLAGGRGGRFGGAGQSWRDARLRRRAVFPARKL